jgi:hypothetical protein
MGSEDRVRKWALSLDSYILVGEKMFWEKNTRYYKKKTKENKTA